MFSYQQLYPQLWIKLLIRWCSLKSVKFKLGQLKKSDHTNSEFGYW